MIWDPAIRPRLIRKCAWCDTNLDGGALAAPCLPEEAVVSHGICPLCRERIFADWVAAYVPPAAPLTSRGRRT